MSSPPKEIVWLIGLPGSGKSTVGRALARRLGCRFVDLDTVVAREAGRDIPAIFREEGEAGFRDREQRALRSLASRSAAPRVVACGGGVVCRRANRERLTGAGPVVWLDVPPETARRRCAAAAGARPLIAVLHGQPRRLAARLAHYARLGTRVDATRPVARTVARVQRLLAGRG